MHALGAFAFVCACRHTKKQVRDIKLSTHMCVAIRIGIAIDIDIGIGMGTSIGMDVDAGIDINTNLAPG